MKTLILGGYGNFGARIARALAGNEAIELYVAGRDLARAQRLASELGGSARGVALDIEAPQLAGALRALQVELVIHTAGPFQGQGFAVAEQVANAGAHYIDLADGRRFVCDLPAALDARFQAAGRVAIAGASTVPALSSAVVDHLTAGWQRIDSIDTCIAPAQTAPRGLATMEAVLGYCGQAIPVWSEGRWQTLHGWARPGRVRFQRLKPRLGALCDIPDLELFPTHYRVAERVMFRAALEVGFTQRALAVTAALAQRGLVREPKRWAKLLNDTAHWFDRWGSALGGMVVRVRGVDEHGRDTERAWHIAADDDHGPEIPCMAAILLARKLARGEAVGNKATGAQACVSLLTLDEFAPEFQRWQMVTDIVEGTEQA